MQRHIICFMNNMLCSLSPPKRLFWPKQKGGCQVLIKHEQAPIVQQHKRKTHTRRRKDRRRCSVVPWLWGWLSTVASSHGFSKSIYLCTCHNLSTVVRQADIFNTFHICNGIWFKTYDSEMQKYYAIFHTHTALHTSLIRNNS